MRDWTFVTDQGPAERSFLRPAWFQAWDLAYGDDRNWRRPVQYISLSRGSSSHCVLPLATQRAGLFQFASLCGTFLPFRGVPYCGDPCEVAAEAVAALRDFRSVVGVRFGPTPDSDPLLTAITNELTHAGWRMLHEEIGSEFILENPGGVEKYAATLSSNRRRNCERYWRKLCDRGPTELRHFQECDTSDWLSVLRDVRTVEAASWIAKHGEPRFMGPKNEQFWETLIADRWYRQALNVWVIYHAGEAVSFNLALDAGGTRYEIANSFDSRVAEFSTGTKINQELIFDAFSRGIARINSGLGDSGYKSGWGARALSTLVNVFAFAPSWRGSVAYLAAQAKEFVLPKRRRSRRGR